MKHQITLKNPNILNGVAFAEKMEQFCFVLSVEALSDGLVVGLSNVEKPVTFGMQVSIEAEVRRPARVSVVLERNPRNIDVHYA